MPSLFQVLLSGYFWGGDICRVNAVCEEHSHAESPAGQHQRHPQDELSAAAAASPNTAHQILSQYHLLLNRLWRTYRFITVFFRTDKPLFFFLFPWHFVCQELSSNKKTCCCCRWGCMKKHWCTFLLGRKIIIFWFKKQTKSTVSAFYAEGGERQWALLVPASQVKMCDVSSSTLLAISWSEASVKKGVARAFGSQKSEGVCLKEKKISPFSFDQKNVIQIYPSSLCFPLSIDQI